MNTSLFGVRRAVGDLIVGGMPPGVEVLWDAPTNAEDLASGILLGWADPIDVTVEPYTMPDGIQETYDQTLFLQVLPTSDGLTAEEAAENADEVFGFLLTTMHENPHPDVEGWDVRARVSGYSARSGLWGKTNSYAAGFDVRIGVEATRCS